MTSKVLLATVAVAVNVLVSQGANAQNSLLLITSPGNAQYEAAAFTANEANDFCVITGPGNAPCGAPVTFTATSPALAGQTFSATWSLLNNTAGASFVGPTTCTNVQSCGVVVTASSSGSVVVRVILNFGFGVLKTCQVTLTVAGGGTPTGTCPPDITVPCPGPIDPSVTGTPTFSNNCGPITTSFVDTIAGSNCAGSITMRTWTAMNALGQSATCTQTITRSSVPSITCPAAIAVQCFAQVPPPDIGSVTASDGCGGAVTVTHVGDVASNGTSNCVNSITRTYRATNACGTQATCTQTISITDTTPPSISCPGPVTVQCFSAVPAPSIASVTASNNCGGAVTIIHLGDSATNGASSCNNVITRTYRATDSCGNQNTCTQIITVNDTTPPTLTCPGASSFQCFSAVPAPNVGLVTASDNCGGPVTVNFVSDSATNGTSSCNNVITRTYSATDPCGNVGLCSQVITVNDTTAPSITCPGPLTVPCFSAVPAPNIGSVTASDNCLVTVTHLGDSASNGTSSCNNVITRTYQAADSCGNMNTCTQTITVNDTTPPTLTCPGALSVQCFSQVPAPSITAVTAADNCGGPVTVTFVSDLATNGTSNCNNVITRTYNATDACGNTNTCTQTITVNDTTPPTLTCPGALSLQCFSQVPAPSITGVTATDNCGGAVTVTFVSSVATNGTSNCNNLITRTYSATDACGNQSTCTQTITVNDTTPPTLTCPGPVSFQCFSQVPAPSITGVTATDNCGGPVTVTFVSDVGTNGTSSCNNVITRTYQGVDACGNVGLCSQVISVNDTTPPSIMCPGPASVQCFSAVPAPNTTAVTVSDNCGGAVSVTFVSDIATNGTSSCNNVITRTYTVTDSCGNMSTCTQTITVNDTTPPSITCPGPATVQCFSAVPAPSIGSVTASDNCGGSVTVTFVSDSATNGASSCNNVITRTYSATDACGNMNTCTQTITVNDTTPPTLTCPGALSLQCFSQVPAPSITGVTATDNCGGPVTVTFVGQVASNGTSNCSNVITRTYQATDSCGNTNTCVQIITVNDTTPPGVFCPPPQTFTCFAQVPAPAPGTVAGSDNCGGLVTFTHVGDSATNGTSSCNNVITRTYMGTDTCGNTATCTQVYTVNDTTAPTITCPGPLSFQCFSQIPAANPLAVTTSDNCVGTVVVTHAGDSATNGTSSCNNVITRTYVATDPCGNQNTCIQTITVNDTTPPTITCLGPVTLQCFANLPLPTPGLIVASDNCGGPVTVNFVGQVASNGTSNCSNVITRTYQATDSCGNTNTCVQIITVNDTTPPGVFCPPPQTFTCFAQVPAPAPGTVAGSDNCGGLVTFTHVGDSATNGTSSCNNVITRTYTATDACGNMNTCTQTITVNDTTPPTLTCPGPATVQCFSAVPAPSITGVTASDNCGGTVTVTFVNDVASNGTSSCNNVITRTYRATDSCGNSNTCTQLITVNDTIPPTLTCPGPATVQCFSAVPVPNTSLVTASDNCGGTVTVTFVNDVATNGTSSCNNVITRTYRATDSCGNSNTCAQLITVNDTIPPSITCPGPASVQCFAAVPTPNTTAVTASDNCAGTVTVSFVGDSATNGTSSCNNVITRTYSATDACGNMNTCTQTITVNDTTPPTITCPGPVTLQCFSLVPPATPGLIAASDNCGGAVTVTFVSDVASNGTSSCNNVITRTYQAVDGCGNTNTCTQIITVNDTTPPGVFCPPPQTFTCFAQVPAPVPGTVAGSDNCGGLVTFTHVGDSATNGTSSCNNVITRTYMGTDTCGNTATCTQVYTVNDTTPPSITCPGPATVGCFSAVPAPSITGVTASDNCGGAVTVTFVSDVASNGTSSCNNVITRTYRATDACGNTNTCTQLITVNDTTPPSITCPGPATVQCFSAVPAPSIGSVTASDNCGGVVTVTFLGDVATNGTTSCNNVITRTYRATDPCGNQNTCTQTITVNDTTPPTLTCPPTLSPQCFSLVPAPSITAVIATDNCGGLVTVTFVSDVATNGTSSCNNVITRTYSATDACGNTNTCAQIIAVNDTTPPSITCPGPATVGCFSAVPAPSITGVTATDNCGGLVTVTFVADVPTNGTSSCNNVITRTYSATDACGNTNTCAQTITVNDTTPPTITCPGPATVQCFSLVPTPSIPAVTATDNCGGAVTVTFVSDVATNGTSSCNNVITRTYSATDPCGNMSTCTQTITINDTTVPSLTCPAPIAVQCFAQVPPPAIGSVTATDNCGGTVTVSFVSDVATNGTSNCMNVITRTYQGVDACGNVGLCSQVITVNDTTPPVITCPADFTAVCGTPTDPGTTGTATATDNCNPAPVISFSDVVSGSCPVGVGAITRTWTASDGCQSVSCNQIITLTPPETGCVFDRGGGCGAPTAAVLTASFQTSSITPQITGAAPNAQVVLAAQLPPYGPATALAGSCTLHVSPTMPPTLVVGTFQTDALGSWTSTFAVPAFPKHTQALLQAVVSTPTPGPLGNLTLTRALDVRRPCECTVTGSTITSNFNGTPIAAGRTIWFNAVLKPSRFPDTGATVRFHQSTIAFTALATPYVLNVPASLIVWDPAATTAETHFDVGAGEWRTTVPANYDKEVFLAGIGFVVTSNLPGGIDPVTWRGSFSTDVERADFQWKWAAAVYTTFSTDPNALGVKPVEGSSLSIYANADHAGTPENFKAFVIGGARGGGGSNYTGSYSGTERTGCDIVTTFFPPE